LFVKASAFDADSDYLDQTQVSTEVEFVEGDRPSSPHSRVFLGFVGYWERRRGVSMDLPVATVATMNSKSYGESQDHEDL
jgi:hypothetical protein